MNYTWIGAILVIASCAGAGFSMAASYCREEQSLRQLLGSLDLMECELQYRMTPLPDLCRQAGQAGKGAVSRVLTLLAQELDGQISPDVHSCMYAALAAQKNLPQYTLEALKMLGQSLGRFDLEGQLNSLESVRGYCRRQLEELSDNKENRIRSYQTLGLCAGAALAILFV